MKVSTISTLSLTLAGVALAAPACKSGRDTTNTDSTCDVSVTVAQVEAFAPGTKSCTTTGGECASAETVTKWINKAICQYGVTKNEMIAVVANMAFESGDFVYRVNTLAYSQSAHAGQGTANMQGVDFNFAYANSFPALKSQLTQFATASAMTDDQKNTVLLPLVTADEYNFGSGFWYLTSQDGCTASRQALNEDVASSFTSFVTDCVGTYITTERTDYMKAVLSACSA